MSLAPLPFSSSLRVSAVRPPTELERIVDTDDAILLWTSLTSIPYSEKEKGAALRRAFERPVLDNDIVNTLLEHGAQFASEEDAESAFRKGLASNNATLCRMLLVHRALDKQRALKIAQLSNKEHLLLEYFYQDPETPAEFILDKATRYCHPSVVKDAFLKNTQSSGRAENFHLLEKAIESKCEDLVVFYLQQGVQASSRDASFLVVALATWCTPPTLALFLDSLEIPALSLDEALFDVAFTGKIDNAELLLSRGAPESHLQRMHNELWDQVIDRNNLSYALFVERHVNDSPSTNQIHKAILECSTPVVSTMLRKRPVINEIFLLDATNQAADDETLEEVWKYVKQENYFETPDQEVAMLIRCLERCLLKTIYTTKYHYLGGASIVFLVRLYRRLLNVQPTNQQQDQFPPTFYDKILEWLEKFSFYLYNEIQPHQFRRMIRSIRLVLENLIPARVCRGLFVRNDELLQAYLANYPDYVWDHPWQHIEMIFPFSTYEKRMFFIGNRLYVFDKESIFGVQTNTSSSNTAHVMNIKHEEAMKTTPALFTIHSLDWLLAEHGDSLSILDVVGVGSSAAAVLVCCNPQQILHVVLLPMQEIFIKQQEHNTQKEMDRAIQENRLYAPLTHRFSFRPSQARLLYTLPSQLSSVSSSSFSKTKSLLACMGDTLVAYQTHKLAVMNRLNPFAVVHVALKKWNREHPTALQEVVCEEDSVSESFNEQNFDFITCIPLPAGTIRSYDKFVYGMLSPEVRRQLIRRNSFPVRVTISNRMPRPNIHVVYHKHTHNVGHVHVLPPVNQYRIGRDVTIGAGSRAALSALTRLQDLMFGDFGHHEISTTEIILPSAASAYGLVYVAHKTFKTPVLCIYNDPLQATFDTFQTLLRESLDASSKTSQRGLREPTVAEASLQLELSGDISNDSPFSKNEYLRRVYPACPPQWSSNRKRAYYGKLYALETREWGISIENAALLRFACQNSHGLISLPLVFSPEEERRRVEEIAYEEFLRNEEEGEEEHARQ